MPQPTWLVQAGQAKEPSWGTATVPPTMSVSVDAPVFNEDQEEIKDTGVRGVRSMTQGIRFGSASTVVNWPSMPWYGDDSGHFAMAMMGADAVTGTARTGTLSAVSAGGTAATYTPGTGGSTVTGDIFVIDAGLPTQEIVVPTSIAANVWTVPATGLNSFKFAHTGGAAVKTLFQHVISQFNTGAPPSYTCVKYDNLVATARQVTGVYYDQLDVDLASPGKFLHSVKGLGKFGSDITKPVFPAYSAEVFDTSWQASFVIAGVANARLTGFKASFKAKSNQIFGMNGTQSATAAISSQLTLTGSVIVVPDDYTEFRYYVNNTQPSVLLTADTGSTRTVLQMSQTAFLKPANFDHAPGPGFTTYKANWEAVTNATDGVVGNAVCKWILWNGRSTAY